MKNFLLAIFVAISFSACARGIPSISASTSEPMFVTPKSGENRVFVMFKNSAGISENNTTTYVVNEFVKNGFVLADDIKNADFVVLGDVIGFQRVEVRDYDAFMNFGFGRRYSSIGFGFPLFRDYDESYTNSYYYQMSASVQIKTKNGDTKSTNISLKSGGHTYSPSYILPYFNERLAKQVVGFFYKI
ncbi:hypothetical protein [Campylobacter mucosalis]|uniref:hypothetical protein n=1 Tax=Campylobacter mucosalis TaxID=202 RepID=UPI0004D36BC8|nr:hypothetical protein [Campylobacter mucosalis]KEA45969.1 hypothetical protein CR66_04125 [Campylobacter mucosalis]QKF63617.1 putative TraT complement resistance protein [Campylobacter mucosalis]